MDVEGGSEMLRILILSAIIVLGGAIGGLIEWAFTRRDGGD